MNVLRTIILPAGQAPKARALGKEVDKRGDGMFTTGLSATGLPPATHFISSGIIDTAFATVLGDGLMLNAAAEAGAKAQGLVRASTKADALDTVAQAVVHDGFDLEGNPEDPHALLARLGLKIISAETQGQG